MRLIDADALKKAFYNKECWSVVIGSIIDNAPTVETKTVAECIIAYGDGYETARRLYERPQGEWIMQTYYDGFTYWKCSNCGKKNEFEVFEFCPNCGAKMEIEQ